ncbi:MAG: DUF502 domain-containing protein [Gammaproteobacteria bacterium]|nr:DUF502 domain-containing protein [Gammaproteobacteria bacterium]MCW8986561.1 DUF502 domain-containing protein [Gammaproteobacteria bacterium]MCW9031916.1 DUF502 domain-containing protein [Gammaproteobacteria bacterium]
MTRIRNFIYNIFIGGLIVLLPVIIIFNIGQWLFDIFQHNTLPLTRYLTATLSIDKATALILSLIAVFILFSVIGMIVRTQIGGGLFQFFERLTLFRIPGYETIKDITAQITGKQKGLFRKVALIKVGNTGVAATGFIVDEIDEGHSTVFIPCGPNPTTGFILHIKNDDITEINVSVEKAMKTVIACGAGSTKLIPENFFAESLHKPGS